MSQAEQLEALLERWAEARAQGRELSAEVLCHDSPELLSAVRSQLEILREMAALLDGSESDSNAITTPAQARIEADSMSAETLAKALSSFHLVEEREIEKAKRVLAAENRTPNASELVSVLIREGQLTPYQAEELAADRAGGLVLGNYLLLEPIGAGGMGQVFKARHRRMKRVVAVKLLKPSAYDSQASLQRFQREVEAVARLNHPNIVAAYDADEVAGRPYLAMEYVEGSDLAAFVKKQGPLPVRHALIQMLQATRGLAYAHAQGVVHRDIKPANLLLDRSGTLRILDLGLARMQAPPQTEAENLTGTGNIMGTADYMAPEQALDTHSVDARADVYSLGCTLYFLLTGKPPYRGDTWIAKVLAHREQPIPDVRSANPEIPTPVANLIFKMLAKQPEGRNSSMEQLQEDLRICLAACEVAAPLEAIPELPADSPKPNTRWKLWGGLAVLIAFLLLGVVWLANQQNEAPIVPQGVPIAPEGDRAIAQWVLKQGGWVSVHVGDDFLNVQSPAQLPSETDLRLAVIDLPEGTQLEPYDLEQLANSRQLTSLSCYGSNVNDAAGAQLAAIKSLQQLSLGKTGITNAILPHLASLPNLVQLRIGETDISDAGLKHLHGISTLRELDLRLTKVSESGVRELQQTLPDCHVMSDFDRR